MGTVLLLVFVILATVVALVLLRKPKSGREESPVKPAPPLPRQPAKRAEPAAPAPETQPERPVPEALAAFRWVRREALSEERQRLLMIDLRGVPRPPSSLYRMLSPAFLSSGTSQELSDIILAEPPIAAKVLALVNSPAYGLQKPVESVGHSVTFLGLNSVRSVCLQYILYESFKAETPELQRIYDTTWNASALAGEICELLAQRLALPDSGVLVTQSVLSFFGRLAMPILLKPDDAAASSMLGLLERTAAEQKLLGLGAAEIGGLLMRHWELPESIVEAVVDVDRVLVTPCDRSDPARARRLAVCYLSARLGERLARGELESLSGYDPLSDPGDECFHLHGYLALPGMDKVGEHLQAPQLAAAIRRMTGGARRRSA